MQLQTSNKDNDTGIFSSSGHKIVNIMLAVYHEVQVVDCEFFSAEFSLIYFTWCIVRIHADYNAMLRLLNRYLGIYPLISTTR
jgi:hypothetical protein